jgi:hypothetical protein
MCHRLEKPKRETLALGHEDEEVGGVEEARDVAAVAEDTNLRNCSPLDLRAQGTVASDHDGRRRLFGCAYDRERISSFVEGADPDADNV